MEKSKTHLRFTRLQRYLILSLIPLYFIVAGFALNTPEEIRMGLLTIVREPDILITDYIQVGGIGAAFVNASLLMLLSIWLCYFLGKNEDGHTITAACLMFGFSLFGKNIMNIWAILAGTWLYARYHRTHMSRYIYVALYGTSLSPVITQLLYVLHLPYALRIIIAISIGVFIGFILPPIATHVHYAHLGYSLYNVGFAAGIIATVLVSLLKAFDVLTYSRLIWSSGNNQLLTGILAVLFGSMIGIGLAGHPLDTLKKYGQILGTTGIGGTDYLRDMGGQTVMFNMGVNGMAATLAVLLVKGELNGPTIGGIFTIVGFSATGKHVRNIIPVMAGCGLASLTGFWEVNSPSALLALLFCTTLAPVAGEFGIIAGIIAGFLHAAVAMQIGVLYAGMNLYNNGFAGGVIAIFMVPVMQAVRDRRAKAKGDAIL